MNLTYEDAMKALLINKMLIEHIDNQVEYGLALAVYVFRFPPKYLRLIQYKDRPFRQLVLDSPGILDILLEVELKPNPIIHTMVDTYIGGSIADLMIYEPLKGGDAHDV